MYHALQEDPMRTMRVRLHVQLQARRAIGIGLAALLVFALACASMPFWSPSVSFYDDRLAESGRSQADRDRDAGRKPAGVLVFLDVEPGMSVLDLIAAGGWYTEVLSVAVGPDGSVYAQNPEVVLKMREGVNDKALTSRLANSRLPNVVRLDQPLGELTIAAGSVDVAITALNFHDIYNGRGPDAARAFLTDVMELLRPGGTFGIIDHSGGVGDDKELHRIGQVLVEQSARDAGFEIIGRSDLLRNPADDRLQNVFAPDIRGKTDRFILRLRKPS
jgi:predicted methyltransferase